MWSKAPLRSHEGFVEDLSRPKQRICEVWSWNFDAEFGEFLAAAAACGDGGLVALDTEFPGFLRVEPQTAHREVRYQALCENCNNLRPIQLGISVSSSSGLLFGTWSFNLCFDIAVDLHTEAAALFLTAAGIDFPRHATEGIDPGRLGHKLATSTLMGSNGCRPYWVTFQGWYDFGYVLKMITGWPLPQDVARFDNLLDSFFPRRKELRDALPRGSLDTLARERGIDRIGMPHTAGSDALATLELFLKVELREGGFHTSAKTTRLQRQTADSKRKAEALGLCQDEAQCSMEFIVAGNGWEAISMSSPQQLPGPTQAHIMQAMQAAQSIMGPMQGHMQVQCVQLNLAVDADPMAAAAAVAADPSFQAIMAGCHDLQMSCHEHLAPMNLIMTTMPHSGWGHNMVQQQHNMLWGMPMAHMPDLATVAGAG